jgi:hypothetical protein
MKHLLLTLICITQSCSSPKNCKARDDSVPGSATMGFYSLPVGSIEFKKGDVIRPVSIRSSGSTGQDGLVEWLHVEPRDGGIEALIGTRLPPGFELAPPSGRTFRGEGFSSVTAQGKGNLSCPILQAEAMYGIVSNTSLRDEQNNLVSFSVITVPLAESGEVPFDAPEGMSFKWLDVGCPAGPLYPNQALSESVTSVGLELTTKEGTKVVGRVGATASFSTGGRDYEFAVSRASQRANNACGGATFTIYEKGFIVRKAAE